MFFYVKLTKKHTDFQMRYVPLYTPNIVNNAKLLIMQNNHVFEGELDGKIIKGKKYDKQ